MAESLEGRGKYFTPSHETFWKWSVDHQAVEWRQGGTIALRAELVALLEGLTSTGLPPFETILLTIAACREGGQQAVSQLGELLTFSHYPMRFSMVAGVRKVISTLETIAALPRELRTTLEGRKVILALVTENGPLLKDVEFSRECLDWLRQGFRISPDQESNYKPTNEWITDLRGLNDGVAAVNEAAVRVRMATGVEILTAPAPIALDLPEPEPVPLTIDQLLNELADEDEYAGLVHLTRRLQAIVSLPRPISAPDDQPLGGVSDITNRGPFDRLLLSELAHDNDVLMTRVALNEAMYIRREVPPGFPPRQQLVLVDAGIRMWGLPRLYATAAALALATRQQADVPLHMFRASHEDAVRIDLTSRNELVGHLGALELAAHPGAALEDFVRQAAGQPADFVIISSEDALADPDFRQRLAEQQLSNVYLLAVTREGGLRLLSRTRQGERVLKQALLNLNEILAGPPKTKPKLRKPDGESQLPAICHKIPFPLYLHHQLNPENCGVMRDESRRMQVGEHVLLSLTYDRRLTLWMSHDVGPSELSDQIPNGKLLWHSSVLDAAHSVVRVVIGNRQNSKMSLINVTADRVKTIPLDLPPATMEGICEHQGVLYVIQRDHMTLFSISNGYKLSVTPRSRDTPWVSARFFKDEEKFYAAAFDGQGRVFQPLMNREDSYIKVQAIFDCEALRGPVALYDDNSLKLIGNDHVLKFQSRYAGESTSVEETRIGKRRGELMDYQRTIISPDGNCIALMNSADGTTVRRGWFVDLEKMTATQAWGDAPRILNQNFQGAKQSRNLRNRFSMIGKACDRLVLKSVKGTFFEIELQASPERLILRELPPESQQLFQGVEFGKPMELDHIGYTLCPATWNDGSRAVLDSRGLLHLRSADPEIPEMTLVLYDGNVAGWCDLNLVWGDKALTGDNPYRATPSAVLHGWLIPFCRHLR